MPPVTKTSKSAKNKTNESIITMSDVKKEAKSLLDRILGDIKKSSATKQIVLGTSSGWATGFLAMRVGKTAALAMGGGILLLQIANEQGYININWNKVNRNLDKVADKIEEKITGEGPSWMDKTERFIDRKVDQAEDQIKKGRKKAKSWYSGISGNGWQLREVHIFVVSFVAGVAIGIGTS
ncbi:FUN14 domain-containing protein 1 [Leptinotarsa decemlineata]|uniref:FUN14 domain-containing protein 1 n=1 Tax=Leptinotarsa decemlineata TaxID=7539 RepID=UPI000C25356B|nr:FUN14 domain-containing protein 1-like [Leptinotarsa decemlineata]